MRKGAHKFRAQIVDDQKIAFEIAVGGGRFGFGKALFFEGVHKIQRGIVHNVVTAVNNRFGNRGRKMGLSQSRSAEKQHVPHTVFVSEMLGKAFCLRQDKTHHGAVLFGVQRKRKIVKRLVGQNRAQSRAFVGFAPQCRKTAGTGRESDIARVLAFFTFKARLRVIGRKARLAQDFGARALQLAVFLAKPRDARLQRRLRVFLERFGIDLQPRLRQRLVDFSDSRHRDINLRFAGFRFVKGAFALLVKGFLYLFLNFNRVRNISHLTLSTLYYSAKPVSMLLPVCGQKRTDGASFISKV